VHICPLPVEHRGITVKQLKRLWNDVLYRCTQEGWKDPFEFHGDPSKADSRNQAYGKPLRPEVCNLFHVNHYIVSPSTVPDGVWLRNVQRKRYQRDKEIRQKSTGATGHVLKETEGSDVLVRVDRGKFGKPWWANDMGDISMGWWPCTTEETFAEPVRHCSFVERIARKPQKPIWFCSHWWGEPVHDFVHSVIRHAEVRRMPETAPYWVCAYANDQHELESSLSEDPQESSFYKALTSEHCEGVLLLLNDEFNQGDKLPRIAPAMPFTRIWCVFEVSTALQNSRLSLDIISCKHGKSELLTDGFTAEELEKARQNLAWAAETKLKREENFPVTVMKQGLEVVLEKADASVEEDKRRILNCLVGRPLDAAPPREHNIFLCVNAKLRGRFAVAAWPSAVSQGAVEEMGLPRVLREDTERTSLGFFFGWRKNMDDDMLQILSSSFPSRLQNLDINVCGCAKVGDRGLIALAEGITGLRRLKSISLNFSHCKKLTDRAIDFLGSKLSALNSLEEVHLKFIDCDKLTDRCPLVLAATFAFRKLKVVNWDFTMTGIEDEDRSRRRRVATADEVHDLLTPDIAPLVCVAADHTAQNPSHPVRILYVVYPPDAKEFARSTNPQWYTYGEGEWLYSPADEVFIHNATGTSWECHDGRFAMVKAGSSMSGMRSRSTGDNLEDELVGPELFAIGFLWHHENAFLQHVFFLWKDVVRRCRNTDLMRDKCSKVSGATVKAVQTGSSDMRDKSSTAKESVTSERSKRSSNSTDKEGVTNGTGKRSSRIAAKADKERNRASERSLLKSSTYSKQEALSERPRPATPDTRASSPVQRPMSSSPRGFGSLLKATVNAASPRLSAAMARRTSSAERFTDNGSLGTCSTAVERGGRGSEKEASSLLQSPSGNLCGGDRSPSQGSAGSGSRRRNTSKANSPAAGAGGQEHGRGNGSQQRMADLPSGEQQPQQQQRSRSQGSSGSKERKKHKLMNLIGTSSASPPALRRATSN